MWKERSACLERKAVRHVSYMFFSPAQLVNANESLTTHREQINLQTKSARYVKLEVCTS